MAVRFEAYVCSRFIAGIVGSNSAEGMDVRLLCLFLCSVGRRRPLRRADHSFRGVVPSVCECVRACVRACARACVCV